MYSTCLFCFAKLGVNRTLEQFPVGRRLAFDSSKGRLWAVCPNCGRWNLAPLEDRWEAVVECERLFKRATLRSSWGHVSFGRLAEGLELVRVGEALPNELPAWRYHSLGAANARLRNYWNEVGRRRKRRYLGRLVAASTAVSAVGVGATAAAGAGLGAAIILPVALAGILPALGLGALSLHRKARRTVAQVQGDGGQTLALRAADIHSALLSSTGSQLAIRLTSTDVTLVGRDCVWALALWISRLRIGADVYCVEEALHYIEAAGGPDGALQRISHGSLREESLRLGKMPAVVRVVLEIAATGDVEGAATTAELERLERAWKEAEEIAAIADNLLAPPEVEEWLARHRLARRQG